MRIDINPDREKVLKIREAIRLNNGYCPCQLEKTDRTKCICLNFLEGKDGWCHCGLYKKTED